MSTTIIGFTGSLGSGCTTSAKHLADKGYQYISITLDLLGAFAKEIKVSHLFQVKKSRFSGILSEEN